MKLSTSPSERLVAFNDSMRCKQFEASFGHAHQFMVIEQAGGVAKQSQGGCKFLHVDLRTHQLQWSCSFAQRIVYESGNVDVARAEEWVGSVCKRFVEGVNRKFLGFWGLAQTGDLRKNKPDPVAPLRLIRKLVTRTLVLGHAGTVRTRSGLILRHQEAIDVARLVIRHGIVPSFSTTSDYSYHLNEWSISQ